MRDPAKEATFKVHVSLHTASLDTLKNKFETDGRAKIRMADKSGAKEALRLYLAKREAVRCANNALTGFRTIVNKFGYGDTTEDVVDGITREADELLDELVEQMEKTRKVVDEEE